MFSGLVRDFGIVVSYNNNLLCFKSNLMLDLGDSVSVNGACLTIVSKKSNIFEAELSNHTHTAMATENLEDLVHLEPSLKLSDGLHGHLVQGHIDGIGTISAIIKDSMQTKFIINVDDHICINVVDKGSICVDGISLTVSRVVKNSIELIIIPHTFNNTLFKTYEVGRRVNIETDIIVRSIVSVIHKCISNNNIDKLKQINNKPKALVQDLYDEISLSY